MMDDLGNRMKLFEEAESGRRFLPLLPICVRLDGRSFSRFTKGLERPYDQNFSNLMIETTKYLVEETNACIGYTQSDEISLIYYSDNTKSQVFFDGRIQKMTSVLASMCTLKFNRTMQKLYANILFENKNIGSKEIDMKSVELWGKKIDQNPVFDCRVWVVPNQIEAYNNLLWREIDATKNSITMAAREYYSDKELFKKDSSEKQEMLFKKGINWNDYPSHFKRGTYIQRRKVFKRFTTKEIDSLPEKHKAKSNPDLMVERTEVRILNMPPLNQLKNKIEVIFNGSDPI